MTSEKVIPIACTMEPRNRWLNYLPQHRPRYWWSRLTDPETGGQGNAAGRFYSTGWLPTNVAASCTALAAAAGAAAAEPCDPTAAACPPEPPQPAPLLARQRERWPRKRWPPGPERVPGRLPPRSSAHRTRANVLGNSNAGRFPARHRATRCPGCSP